MNWPCLLTAAEYAAIALAVTAAAGSLGVGFGYLMCHDRIKLALSLAGIVLTLGFMALFYFNCIGVLK